MLEKLNALPPLPPSVVKPKRPVPAKKKSKNIIKVPLISLAAANTLFTRHPSAS